MAQSTKLNKVGEKVLKALKNSCVCWKDVTFGGKYVTNMYYSFEIKQDTASLSSPVITKVIDVCNAFELTGECYVCASIKACISGDAEYPTARPIIEVAVSLKD